MVKTIKIISIEIKFLEIKIQNLKFKIEKNIKIYDIFNFIKNEFC